MDKFTTEELRTLKGLVNQTLSDSKEQLKNSSEPDSYYEDDLEYLQQQTDSIQLLESILNKL